MTELAPETPEQELARYKRHLKSEQDSARKLMERFCKAMGAWEGPWDNEVRGCGKHCTAKRVRVRVTHDQSSSSGSDPLDCLWADV